uniref:Uncharacterized protein n=1 Tax=Arundo donax TaxID=35708 RepID=A0A0A9BYG2_ARUDO
MHDEGNDGIARCMTLLMCSWFCISPVKVLFVSGCWWLVRSSLFSC